MSEIPERRPDSLDELLTPPVGQLGDVVRRDMLARTTRVLRRRRRVSQLTRLACLAACYVAGMLTVYDFRPETSPPAPRPIAPSTSPSRAGTSALALEWRAIDHPEQAGTAYRAAGDRYLAENADPGAAARCYGSALSAGPAEDLTIDPNDSWLMMAIKDARQKEARDANRLQ
jgi:hypothetical protein